MPAVKIWIWLVPLIVLGVFASLNLPICPSRVLVGVFCPGCGLTRATLDLISGDLQGMMLFHPLAPLLSPLIGWIFIHELLVELGRIPQKGPLDLMQRLPRWGWIGIAILALGTWLARAMGFLGGLPNPLFEPGQSLLFGGSWPDA